MSEIDKAAQATVPVIAPADGGKVAAIDIGDTAQIAAVAPMPDIEVMLSILKALA